MSKISYDIFGITARDKNTIDRILDKYPEVELVYVFGSRAKGNFKIGSDIDLAIMNAKISARTIHNIVEDFEESSLPYFVDLVHVDAIQHQDLKEHIWRVGQKFYSRV